VPLQSEVLAVPKLRVGMKLCILLFLVSVLFLVLPCIQEMQLILKYWCSELLCRLPVLVLFFCFFFFL